GVRDRETLEERRIHGSQERSQSSAVFYTIVIVIISAILFVTVIAIYDVARNAISNYYAAQALRNPDSHNTPTEIEAALIANQQALIASGVFAAVCVLLALIIVPLLIVWVILPHVTKK